MQTVQSLANQLGLVKVITRAMEFHPVLENNPGLLWAIPVTFSLTMETSAGWFRAKPNRISLHMGLIGPMAKLGELAEVFLHELAHAMQWEVYGRVDHAATWWEMMHQLGQKPVRTHSIAACKRAKDIAPGSVEQMGL